MYWRNSLGCVTGVKQCAEKASKTITDMPDIDDEIVIERAHRIKNSN